MNCWKQNKQKSQQQNKATSHTTSRTPRTCLSEQPNISAFRLLLILLSLPSLAPLPKTFSKLSLLLGRCHTNKHLDNPRRRFLVHGSSLGSIIVANRLQSVQSCFEHHLRPSQSFPPNHRAHLLWRVSVYLALGCRLRRLRHLLPRWPLHCLVTLSCRCERHNCRASDPILGNWSTPETDVPIFYPRLLISSSSTMDSLNGTRTRLPTPAKFLGRTKRKRPRISEPIGPIKNSRGPDLVRSESLMIVPGIKDCSPTEILPQEEAVGAKKTTRRISASFNKQGLQPLSGSPTVAKSDVNATTLAQALPSKLPTKRVPPTHGRKVALTASSTFNIIPSLDKIPQVQAQTENIPPAEMGATPPTRKPPNLPKSQLPKSRTMSVLTELKSISRPSLASRAGNSRLFSGSSRKTSTSSSSSTLLGASSSRLRLPRPSLTSLPRSSRPTTPETAPAPMKHGQISTSQSSAYWSGRFMSLHDRYLSEGLN